MTDYLDEQYLTAYNQRLMHRKLTEAANGDSWMSVGMDECLEGLERGTIDLRDGQTIGVAGRSALGGQLALLMPESFHPDIPIGQGRPDPTRSYFLDRTAPAGFGVKWLDIKLGDAQLEAVRDMLLTNSLFAKPEMKVQGKGVYPGKKQPFAYYEALFLAGAKPFYQVVLVGYCRHEMEGSSGKGLMASAQFPLPEAGLYYPLAFAMAGALRWEKAEKEVSR
ncbi:hypothetical protein NYE69_20835 [Paenibacillus sp. FSL R5-0527]|uniref:hypothetical protein n=1 Tax=Paenibacillus sp. FSL R5-0527 TaxID=2975321 RepID=UPI00097A9891|nr:hypothetical protein BK140_30260 [Paenibacillus macerans]